jgi:hypothetical protein
MIGGWMNEYSLHVFWVCFWVTQTQILVSEATLIYLLGALLPTEAKFLADLKVMRLIRILRVARVIRKTRGSTTCPG